MLSGNVVGHFGRNHSLNRWIAQYNVHQQQRYGEQLDVELSQIHPEPLTIHNLEEKLRDQGAVLYNEHGLYVAPLKNPLPAISLLDVLPGFMCGFCPVEDVTAVAAFTGAVSTVAKHMQQNHRGLNHNQYTTCHVQHLYKEQGHKVYFRVEQQYSCPTIPSTITSEGDALFENFLCENPEFDEGSILMPPSLSKGFFSFSIAPKPAVWSALRTVSG
ncbi:1-acylglycerol-3-phosphate O-acyltransferase [Mucor velutinosus]|uniref:1-acylglycerol-3-phosphate O-acyltransferase n=1 Tax=Mucor velutinosus TaxID=708070 RepID=A0AAN7HPS5_9FUNG|nr:1-acylglycerol-3-phosphate O-acyltransferase [Mucor velutinosus]